MSLQFTSNGLLTYTLRASHSVAAVSRPRKKQALASGLWYRGSFCLQRVRIASSLKGLSYVQHHPLESCLARHCLNESWPWAQSPEDPYGPREHPTRLSALAESRDRQVLEVSSATRLLSCSATFKRTARNPTPKPQRMSGRCCTTLP